MYQVIYSTNCPLSDLMRNLLCAQLGIWHPAKHCCEVIWRKHARHLLTRLWHSIYPEMTLIRKPSLAQLLTFFTQLKLAYSMVRDTVIKHMQSNMGSAVDKNMRQLLFDLFEFFIPVVRQLATFIILLSKIWIYNCDDEVDIHSSVTIYLTLFF